MSDSIDAIRKNTGLRLMVLFGSFCLLLAVASGIFLVLSNISGIGERSSLLLASAVQCILAFCLPAWLCGKFSSSRSMEWLGLSGRLHLKGVVGVVILYVLALPALNQLIAWNAGMHFPEWAAGLESKLREMEDAAAATTSVILSYSGISGMLATVFVVGILTGFSEELFFRGALQKVLLQSNMGVAASVWVSAFIFSAVHFQFFGFVPRLLMGVMFGYLLIWSKSLWLPVFAHALNNSVVVVSSYFIGTGTSDAGEGIKDYPGLADSGIDSFGIAASGEIPWAALASAIATALFLYRFRKYFFSTQANS
ncbi:MAG: CPBP family intramembrane metalloprotease [Muribaculaceae bacterium]|nr:CPBP family intramembrane metalloprotease [Muribaculaceae bacterium]MDE5712664.1 CPBP family intramembrane metalloprotease [Muribaculaceae bacterium]